MIILPGNNNLGNMAGILAKNRLLAKGLFSRLDIISTM